MMMTPYISQQPVDDFGLGFPNYKYSATLAATTDTTLTIPGGAPRYKVRIRSAGAGVVWAAINATAAVPAGATLVSTTSEMVTAERAMCREVRGGDVLHLFTSTASTAVSVVLWALGSTS